MVSTLHRNRDHFPKTKLGRAGKGASGSACIDRYARTRAHLLVFRVQHVSTDTHRLWALLSNASQTVSADTRPVFASLCIGEYMAGGLGAEWARRSPYRSIRALQGANSLRFPALQRGKGGHTCIDRYRQSDTKKGRLAPQSQFRYSRAHRACAGLDHCSFSSTRPFSVSISITCFSSSSAVTTSNAPG